MDAILVLNAGSSSIKFAVYRDQGDPKRLVGGQIAGIGGTPSFSATNDLKLDISSATDHNIALTLLLDGLQGDGLDLTITAVGHRVVHGGTEFTGPVRITRDIIARLKALIPLAPHHQPHNVAAMETLADLDQVACFDTAFHSQMPSEARQTGLPMACDERGIRRYGFHGLSYEHVVNVLPELTGAPLPARLVIAHLGNGASMCAVKEGISIATTMGFSTLDGLPMGTRSGSIDPGVILHLMRANKLDLDGLEDLLYNQSGLLGLSGISGDMRVLLDSPEPAAKRAVDFYSYRIARELGSLAAALGGLDTLVFTGGIGENAKPVRDDVLARSAWLDFEAWIVPADEETVIARHTLNVLDRS